MKLKPALTALFLLGLSLSLSPKLHAAQGDVARGAKLYDSRCGACHSVEMNRIGPRHRMLFGRTAGTQPDYDYSAALKESDLVWDERSLDRWLTDPQAVIPGQKMGFRIRKSEDRSDIIAFLRSLGTSSGSATE